MIRKFKVELLVGLSIVVLLSGCTSDQLANIEVPTDLTKEVKIDTSKLNVDVANIEEIRKKLASKPVIPEKRETSDLKDPFILKSLKALGLQKEKTESESKSESKSEKSEGKVEGNQEKSPETSPTEANKPINIAEESPMMFNFEGSSLYGAERRAILRHLVNNRTYIVKKGDIVGGYSVVDITDESMVLVKGSEKLVITKKKQ